MGHRLRELRQSRGMTQAAIAKCLNVSPQAVAAYESGSSSMSPQHIDAACRALNTTPMIWNDAATREPTIEDASNFVDARALN